MKIITHTTHEVQDVQAGDIFQCINNDKRKALKVCQLVVITGVDVTQSQSLGNMYTTVGGGGSWTAKGLGIALDEGSLVYVGNVSAPGYIARSSDSPYVIEKGEAV